ncbi:hypothetical protein [Methylophilus aquaticus]|uniref:Uncharacterized protein n=1 Tax=Methylophilus aquaticus TaxID=1971610 RepID=A0ABT9JVH0_9PROT|nr:hypothetical protein [Methylophilus aquaticus]MDP8568590.1 hypothetical protein [Methylophilus aquaticus]
MATIDKVVWHTRIQGNPETRKQILTRFWIIVNFIQMNGLTKRILARSIAEIDDEFSINSDDLTDIGLELMKKAYDKWLTKVDAGMPPADIAILQRTLEKLNK